MWTCVRCKQSVDDQLAVCPHCGAARSAGRFSKDIQPKQIPQAQYTPDFAHVRAGRGYTVFGTLLAVLLPAVVLLAAILCRNGWIGALYHLLNPEATMAELNDGKANLLYWALTAAAILLASLPGLWTVGLGKALRRLNRMEELL